MPATGGPPWTGETSDWSTLLLFQMSNKAGMGYESQNTVGTSFAGARALFLCPSVSIDPGAKSFITHYTAHPRVLPDMNGEEKYQTSNPRPGLKPRKISSIKRSAEIVGIFDGTILQNIGGANSWTATACAYNLDDSRINQRSYLIDDYDSFTTTPKPTAGDPIALKLALNANAPDAPTFVNTDTDRWGGNVRFRHNRDTTLNALMLDGHVESFKFNKQKQTTDLLRRNVYINR
jgi:prepilin-type processing-associated H-X9-DG protein